MTTRVKWSAQLNHVQEVSILGSANLGFWQKRLAGEELTPVDREGRAPILIVGAAGRFMGVRFRELSVSVFVASAEVTSYFLVRAFNSKMFFARIGGSTKVYPFLAGEDTILIQPQKDGDAFHILSESAFVPEAWIIRSNASHAKSKTYKRSENVEIERCSAR